MYCIQPFSNNGSTFRLTNVEKLTLKSQLPKIKSADVFKHAKFAHFETFRNIFDESKPYNALISGIKIFVPKTLANFCNQKIKIKCGMQTTAIFQKWNHFLRIAVCCTTTL